MEQPAVPLVQWRVVRKNGDLPFYLRAHYFVVTGEGLMFYRTNSPNDIPVACVAYGAWELVAEVEDEDADKEED